MGRTAPPDSRPRILVANDDGIFSTGIRSLVDGLSVLGDVTVVAPNAQQSAVGHALTVASPLRVERFEHDGAFFGYAVNGTPADCVKLAVRHLLDEPPDLLVSGINHGRNTGTSIVYSGTVSGATEGTMLGVPSIAISLDSHARDADFSGAVAIAAVVARAVLEHGLPKDVLLNVNVPSLPLSDLAGIRIVPQGRSYWDDAYVERRDPMGEKYYWLKGEYVLVGEGTDDHAVNEGYVAITPIAHHLTVDEEIGRIEDWGLDTALRASDGRVAESETAAIVASVVSE